MYVPEHFSVKEAAVLYDWIERWSFGTLITSHRGRMEANQIPFLVDRERGDLLGHVARSNKQWQTLLNAEHLLVVFNGPHGYVSPAWYSQPDGVPTWNYLTVQVQGKAELVKTENEAIDILRRLTNTNEALYGPGWRLEDLDEARLKVMTQAIVCFRIHISTLEGKAKLSQNRSKMDRVGVIRELSASDDSQLQELSRLMLDDLKQKKAPP
ncbi:MAG: FMN-binding negative transcriptional regulator [Gammaproteobacteria bacterium]|nr:FMN-binding negative transcriptional regulator [Gammaproteobacteria bacterium]